LWSCSVKTGVWLRAKETEISAALWAVRLRKDFTFFNFTFTHIEPVVTKHMDFGSRGIGKYFFILKSDN